MTIIERILSHQLSVGVFEHAEPAHAKHLAQRAVESSFEERTAAEKFVLNPFLSQPCSGVIDPADHHNNCQVILTNEELLDAYQNTDDFESLNCGNCRFEAESYAREWEKFNNS